MTKKFEIKDDRIVLTPEYIEKNKWKFKKITGSRFAACLGYNKYTSPAKAWATMVGIYKEEMDMMFADAGNIIEPKIKSYVEQKLNTKYISYNPMKIGFDIFKDDEVYGGIPDGEPVDANDNLDYNNKRMLEIKTTSIDAFSFKTVNGQLVLQKDENNHPIVKSKGTKKEKWFDKDKNIIVPDEYIFQLSLYCYLRNIKQGVFAVSFLETKDYIDPNKFVVTDDNTWLVDFNLTQDFKEMIDAGRDWYNTYIKNGYSPKITKEDWEWIKTINE